MPCLDAVLKACRRGATKQGRVAALLNAEQQPYSSTNRTCVSGYQRLLDRCIYRPTSLSSVVHITKKWTGRSTVVLQKRVSLVNAAVSRHQIVAMSEVDKAKEAVASGYVYGVLVIWYLQYHSMYHGSLGVETSS